MGRISRSAVFKLRNARIDLGKIFISADGVVGSDRLLGKVGADHVKAVEGGFGGDLGVAAGKAEAGVFDGQIEVLDHFVLANDLTHGDADAVLAAQRIALARNSRPDAGEFFLGHVQKFPALSGALRRQHPDRTGRFRI